MRLWIAKHHQNKFFYCFSIELKSTVVVLRISQKQKRAHWKKRGFPILVEVYAYLFKQQARAYI